jgi:hypothetical protein
MGMNPTLPSIAFGAIENRREVEHLALDAVENLHARHGWAGSLCLRGSRFAWQAKRGREYDFAQPPKGEVECTREYRNESQKDCKAG